MSIETELILVLTVNFFTELIIWQEDYSILSVVGPLLYFKKEIYKLYYK